MLESEAYINDGFVGLAEEDDEDDDFWEDFWAKL